MLFFEYFTAFAIIDLFKKIIPQKNVVFFNYLKLVGEKEKVTIRILLHSNKNL